MRQSVQIPTYRRWTQSGPHGSGSSSAVDAPAKSWGRIALLPLAVVVVLLVAGWIGLRIEPEPFVRFSPRTTGLRILSLPDSLPPPVQRFYHRLYPNGAPDIRSAVITGRGSIRRMGLSFPARFRIAYEAGRGCRQEIEATFFARRVMRIDRIHLDGGIESSSETGGDSLKVAQAANLGMWAESVWLPSLWITDSRLRWTPYDENTALLHVPFGNGRQHFVVSFDPETGMLTCMQTMRFRDVSNETKSLWLAEILEWGIVDGHYVPVVGSATWMGDDAAYATLTVESIVYNVDVDRLFAADGDRS